MIRSQAERIAHAINTLRPDWPTRSLITLMAAERRRPARDVAVALAWLALDPDTRTPGRLHESGPWWPTAATQTAQPERVEPGTLHTGPDHPANPETVQRLAAQARAALHGQETR